MRVLRGYRGTRRWRRQGPKGPLGPRTSGRGLTWTELGILQRTPEGCAQIARLPLDGRLASNVAAAVDRQGQLSLAAATDEGRLRLFR